MVVLGYILFGFIVGLIARAVMPGRDPMGLVGTTVLGISGALLGGWLGRVLGLYGEGAAVGYLAATLGAVVVLGAYNLTMRRRTRASGRKKTDDDRQRPAA